MKRSLSVKRAAVPSTSLNFFAHVSPQRRAVAVGGRSGGKGGSGGGIGGLQNVRNAEKRNENVLLGGKKQAQQKNPQ